MTIMQLGLGHGIGRFTLAGTTELRVEHRVETTELNTGLGEAATFGNVEVYTVARFWKVS